MLRELREKTETIVCSLVAIDVHTHTEGVVGITPHNRHIKWSTCRGTKLSTTVVHTARESLTIAGVAYRADGVPELPFSCTAKHYNTHPLKPNRGAVGGACETKV